MTEPQQAPPRDDVELSTRIDAATRPAPWTPFDRARFRAGVAARVEKPVRAWWWLALAGSLAAGAAAFVLATRAPSPMPSPSPAPEIASAYAVEAFFESYDEEVLFAPEWADANAPSLDAETVPGDYRAAAALLEL